MPLCRFANGTKCLNTDTITYWEDDGTTLTVEFQNGMRQMFTETDRADLLAERQFVGGRPQGGRD